MNKELEEAIGILRRAERWKDNNDTYSISELEAISTVLNHIENSIPKKKVEEEINFIKTLDEKLYYQENVIQILQGLLEGK